MLTSLLHLVLRLAVVLALLCVPAWAAEKNGKQIYAEMCAKCHGMNGEGTDEEYPERLIGELSVGELARLIDKTMPYQHPEKVNAEQSLLVSTYIHDAFYSPIAQERNRPARVELSRLTVRQYQNSVSDLVGSFRKSGDIDPHNGLKAEYYKGRRF